MTATKQPLADRSTEQLKARGVLQASASLASQAQGARVQLHDGRRSVLDGPFAEAKELIAGFSLIDVPSLEEAIAWARRWPAIDMEANVALEIRPLFEESDFAEWQETWQHAAPG